MQPAEATLIAPVQLALPLDTIADARLVQHANAGGWRGYATLNRRSDPTATMLEWRFPVDRMPWVIDQALRAHRGTHDLYIAQHSYATDQRSTATLLSLNIAHIDLDVYKSDWAGQSEGVILTALLNRLDAWHIPHPSYIVDSGRGLQLKWLWTSPLSPKSTPRWQAAHRQLVSEVLYEFEADSKAILPTQIMRLVGSKNLASGGRSVRVAWVNGGDLATPVQYDFDAWCDAVLPFTRAEVREFRQRLDQYDRWRAENTANLARLADDQAVRSRSSARRQDWDQVAHSLGVAPAKLAAMDDLVAGEIWQRRLDTMSRLQEIRGYTGVPEGQRHSWVWIAANAMGWVNRGQAKPLKADVLAWAKRFVPTYKPAEALSAAAAVLARAKQQPGFGTGLYRMTEGRFRAELAMSADEADQLQQMAGKNRQRLDWHEGVMGFEPMRGLSYDEYRAETARRQAEAGRRSAETRSTTYTPDKREQALKASLEGLSTHAIASTLAVNQSTVSRWLTAAKKE
jgi:hypothetical protein